MNSVQIMLRKKHPDSNVYELMSESKRESPDSSSNKKSETNLKLESLSAMAFNPQKGKQNQKRQSLLAK